MKRAVFALLWAVPFLANAQILLDDFEAGPFSLLNSSGSVEAVQTGLTGHVLGGQRRVLLDDPPPYGSSAELVTGNGYLTYNRVQNGNFTSRYNDSSMAPLHADLTAGGGEAFRLDITSPGPVAFQITVVDATFFSQRIDVVTTEPSSGVYDVSFSRFNHTVDLTDVAWLELKIFEVLSPPYNGPGTYNLNHFAVVVPEPAAGWLCFGAFLLLFAGFRQARVGVSPHF